MYVVIDQVWQHLAPLFSRPGRAPEHSDSELISMAVVGAGRGWHVEAELVSQWHAQRDLFPTVHERSHLNRRRRNLMHAISWLRHPGASRESPAHSTTSGNVVTTKQTIFGYKLHLFCGPCAQLYTKLAAHTLSIYLNRLPGKRGFLHKHLAFPKRAQRPPTMPPGIGWAYAAENASYCAGPGYTSQS